MNIFLTFDYELYFGSRSGTYQNSILKPVEALLVILDRYNVKGTFFVDAGYLCKLEEYADSSGTVASEYDAIKSNIQKLYREGHSIQLHIHPHWEDCSSKNGEWIMDTTRFRLASFSEEDVRSIVKRYKELLTSVIEDTEHVFAYRAGGWCIQPFDKIRGALLENKVWLDSTLYFNGRSNSETHYYNFSGMPKKLSYRFDNDPIVECENGKFLEVPISSYKVTAFFFWRMVIAKKLGGDLHAAYGDGGAAGGGLLDKLRMLLTPTHSVVSVDGYKSSFLAEAFDHYCKQFSEGEFVAIGHPKAFSQYSLSKLDSFLAYYTKQHTFNTFSSNYFSEIQK